MYSFQLTGVLSNLNLKMVFSGLINYIGIQMVVFNELRRDYIEYCTLDQIYE